VKKIKEILVVEGKADTQNIQNVVEADTIETNGSAIDIEVLEQIKKAHQVRGVVVLTDPDYPGERIRKIISAYVPGVKHAFVSKKEAQGIGKDSNLGVEHVSEEALLKALEEARTEDLSIDYESDITVAFLQKMGLINGKGAKVRRHLLGEWLNIGYTNGKQLQKRLEMFRISAQE
jgi:ribonuclease M5